MGWLNDWSYRRAITITEQSGGTLTDYQVKVSLNSSNFDFSKANADGSDIRFTEDDGTTLLNYWIEEWDNTSEEAIIWVKIPSILANGDITIYIYYGNTSATDISDGSAVWDFFDNFETDTISYWNRDESSDGKRAHYTRDGYSSTQKRLRMAFYIYGIESSALGNFNNYGFCNYVDADARDDDVRFVFMSDTDNGATDTKASHRLVIVSNDVATKTGDFKAELEEGYEHLLDLYYIAGDKAGYSIYKDYTLIRSTSLTSGVPTEALGKIMIDNHTGTESNDEVLEWIQEDKDLRSYAYRSNSWVDLRIHWIAEGKYVDIEPDISVGSEEAQAGAEYTTSLSDVIQLSHTDKKELSLYPKEMLNLIDNLYYYSILTKFLSEDVSLNEVMYRQSNLFKILSEDISLNEVIYKQSNLSKFLSEDILLYETTVKWVDLYNTILNTVNISEGKADTVNLTLEDVFTLNELVYYSVTLNQLLQETLTLQEWTNLGGVIFNQLIIDVIDLTEQSGLLLGVNLQDDIFIIEDKLSKINSMLKEDINLTESRDYKKVLLALLSDIIALNEITQKIYTGFMKESESIKLSEKQSKRLEMVLLSILNVSEKLLKAIRIQLEDNLTLIEVRNTALLTSIITDVLLNEAISREVKAQLISILDLNEDFISLKQGLILPHDTKEIYSLIIFTKLLNSDITTINKLYSILNEQLLNSEIKIIKKLYSIIQREVELFK